MSGEPKDEKKQPSQVIPVEDLSSKQPGSGPPESIGGLYREGSLHFKARDYAAASACFERYAALRPDDPAGYHFLARVYYHQATRLDKAEECVKKALELDDGLHETRYLGTLGIIYVQKGDFERAEEVFAYALSQDRGDDKEHTRTLGYYLKLVRRKARKGPKAEGGGDHPGPPPFIKTGIERRREHNRQTLFLIPSVVIHALIFLFMGYLSTHDIAIKPREDFTYVETQQPEEQQEAEQQPKEASGEAQPVPAPVSPRKEAAAGDVSKGGGPAMGKASAPPAQEQAARQQAGGKQMAKLAGGGRAEDMAARPSGEKALGLKAVSPPAMMDENVNFAKKSLGGGPGQASSGASGEASVRGISDRSGSAAATDEGIFLGGQHGSKPELGKSRKAKLGGGRTDEGAAAEGFGEKKLAGLGRPGMPGIKDDLGRFQPSALNIGGISPQRAQDSEGVSIGSVDMPHQAVQPRPGTGAYGLAMAAPGSGASGRYAGTGKGVAKDLGTSKDEGFPGAGFLARAADSVSQALGIGPVSGSGGKRFASLPDVDLRRGRSLGISMGGGQAGGAGRGQGSGGGNGRGSGVSIGNGEKARSSLAGVRASEGSRQAVSGAAGSKKASEGALGIPGNAADRYNSLSRGEARATTPEKRPVVPTTRTLLARNAIGPSVRITSPRSGKTDRLSQVITGNVSDPRIRKATLTINNDSRVISVERGRFESVISLGRGHNTVTVMAFDADGNVGKDNITLDYSTPREGAPVTIASPRDGQVFDVSERSVVSVKGTIGDQEIRKATLILNGNPMDIVVNRGYFDQKVALEQEQNTVLVEVATPDGRVSRSERIRVNTVNVKPKDMMIILTWDKPHADFDLHVYGPDGGHTYYKSPNIYESREAIPGAQLEQDAKNNFGPEVFTQQKAERGVYRIVSNYWNSGGDGNAHATVTVILYGDNPSRRIVRVFGPHLQVDTKDGEDNWEVTKIRMPEGIFLEE